MPRAFLIHTLNFPDLPDPSDEERQELMRDDYAYLYEGIVPVEQESAKQERPTSKKKTKTENTYEQVMFAIRDYPAKSASYLAKVLGTSKENIHSYFERGVRDGYLELKELRLGAGRPTLLPQPTQKFNEKFGRQTLLLKGGIVHEYWARTIQQFHKANISKDYQIQFEYQVGQKSIDVVWLMKTERIQALEIELDDNYEHIIDNIAKCLNAEFRRVIVAVTTTSRLKTLNRKAREYFSETDLGKVLFTTLSEFVPKNGNYKQPERFIPQNPF